LLEVGLKWIAALTEPPASANGANVLGHRAPRLMTDPTTGKRSLTLPVIDPATVQRLAEGLAGLLVRLQRQG